MKHKYKLSWDISTNNTAWGRDGYKTVVRKKTAQSTFVRKKNRPICRCDSLSPVALPGTWESLDPSG
jgi:hypothetical protein